MTGTYVYCFVAATRRPALTRVPAGLRGMGRPRLLEASRGRFLVVADAPLAKYGEDAINRGLTNLDWVARAAVAHEAVVESFIGASAVLPMKLFTIFTNDDRALEHIRGDAPRVDALVRRVANHQEWGVRVVLDRARASAARGRKAKTPRPGPLGKSYLAQKKAQRDTSLQLTQHARETVADLFDRLAARAGLAKRRAASELPARRRPAPARRGVSRTAQSAQARFRRSGRARGTPPGARRLPAHAERPVAALQLHAGLTRTHGQTPTRAADGRHGG